MNLAQILILGLAQGITEFLPVSSTAHLILLPKFFHFPDPGLAFDISLHLGTLLAILIYFRREWLEMVGSLWVGANEFFHPTLSLPVSKSSHSTQSLKSTGAAVSVGMSKIVGCRPFILLLVIATIPGLFFGVLFESWAETIFRAPVLIAASLATFGIILWLVDRYSKRLNDLNHLSKKGAFFVGCWQALAIIPGVSRSGATMTGGLLVGLKREATVKFSFLLSAPIIFGSTLVGFYKIVINGGNGIGAWSFLIGAFASFVAGTLAIKFLLKFIENRSFLPFVIYRIILALLILSLVV